MVCVAVKLLLHTECVDCTCCPLFASSRNIFLFSIPYFQLPHPELAMVIANKNVTSSFATTGTVIRLVQHTTLQKATHIFRHTVTFCALTQNI